MVPRLQRTPTRRTRLLFRRVSRTWLKITSRLLGCFVIVIMASVFLKPSNRGKTTTDLYNRYSAATTTRQYFCTNPYVTLQLASQKVLGLVSGGGAAWCVSDCSVKKGLVFAVIGRSVASSERNGMVLLGTKPQSTVMG